MFEMRKELKAMIKDKSIIVRSLESEIICGDWIGFRDLRRHNLSPWRDDNFLYLEQYPWFTYKQRPYFVNINE